MLRLGPEHAALHDSGRAEYVTRDRCRRPSTPRFASRAPKEFCPRLRARTRLRSASGIAPAMARHDILMVNLSGRGDKDIGILSRELKLQGSVSSLRCRFALPPNRNPDPGSWPTSPPAIPTCTTTREIALAAIDAGADVIELGVPFSDPLADGPVIQRASERAVAHGTTLGDVLAVAAELRQRATRGGPGHLFLFQSGPALRAGAILLPPPKQAGVDGVLVTDMIVEEAGEYLAHLERTPSRARSFLLRLPAPTSVWRRSQRLHRASSTPSRAPASPALRSTLADDAEALVSRLRRYTQAADCRGFWRLQRRARCRGRRIRGRRGDRQRAGAHHREEFGTPKRRPAPSRDLSRVCDLRAGPRAPALQTR